MSNQETLQPMYQQVIDALAQIDEQLDAAAGGKAAGKRSKIKELVTANQTAIDETHVNELVESFFKNDNKPMDVRVAVYYGILRMFRDAFDKQADEWVTTEVGDVPPPVEISDEDYKVLTDSRAEYYKQGRYIQELMTMFGVKKEDIEPKLRRRGGGRGKRGRRAITDYTWTLDGERLDPKEDTFKGLATKLGFGSATDLRKLMEEAEINLKNPTDPIKFNLAADKSPDDSFHMIQGDKKAVDADADDDDDSDEDDSDSDVEDDDDDE